MQGFSFSQKFHSPLFRPLICSSRRPEKDVKKVHKKNLLLIEKSKEKKKRKRTSLFLRTSKNGLKWAFERIRKKKMRKKRRLWNLVCPQPPKVYISYSIIHVKDGLCGDMCPATAGRFPFPIKRKMLIFRLGHKMRI